MQRKRRRILIAPPFSGEEKPAQAKVHRQRKLAGTTPVTKKLTSRSSPILPALSLEELSEFQARKKQRDEYGDAIPRNTSSNSSASDEEAQRLEKGRQRKLKARARSRRYRLLELTFEEAKTQLTTLEKAIVQRRVRVYYRRYLKGLEAFAQTQGLSLQGDDEDATVDLTITLYFNHLYSKGHFAHVGEIVLAAFLDKKASFGKFGSQKIPRSWRSLKG